jgi:transposase-like protein
MRIDVIANTTARRYAARPALVAELRAACAGVAVVHETSSIAELDRAVAAIAARGTDLCVLSGGDGTFMAGVTALARAFGDDGLPRLALVPGGTVATVARNWGMVGDPLAVTRRLLADPTRLRFTARPTLRVEATSVEATSTAPEERRADVRIGFIFGTGLVANFFDVYYAQGARGYAGAARIVARIFAESFWGGPLARRVLDPMPCSIEVEGRRLAPDAWSLVCASVVPDLGIHMRVTYRAAEDPTRPHLVASALTSSRLGPRAPLVLAGRRIGGPGHFDDLAREFVVRFPDGSPGAYVLDGDVLRARSVRVCAGPIVQIAEPPRRASRGREGE